MAKRKRRTRGVAMVNLKTGRANARNMPVAEAKEEFGDIFTGELTCVICQKSETVDDEESDWRALQIGERNFHACPDHFPSDSQGTRDSFAAAYSEFYAACMMVLTGGLS